VNYMTVVRSALAVAGCGGLVPGVQRRARAATGKALVTPAAPVVLHAKRLGQPGRAHLRFGRSSHSFAASMTPFYVTMSNGRTYRTVFHTKVK
jgi:hypothetical protein